MFQFLCCATILIAFVYFSDLPTIFWSKICYNSLFYFFNTFNNFADSFTFSIFQQFIALYNFNDSITFSRIQRCCCCFSSTPSRSQSLGWNLKREKEKEVVSINLKENSLVFFCKLFILNATRMHLIALWYTLKVQCPKWNEFMVKLGKIAWNWHNWRFVWFNNGWICFN